MRPVLPEPKDSFSISNNGIVLFPEEQDGTLGAQ